MNAIDTNVLVYAYDERASAKRARARELIREIGTNGILLWQVACEFMSASRKTLAPDEDAAVIWLRLDEVRKALPLVIPPPETLERARELHVNQHIHFWDAMVYAACIEAGVTRIYSEDLPGSVVAGLEVVNPFS